MSAYTEALEAKVRERYRVFVDGTSDGGSSKGGSADRAYDHAFSQFMSELKKPENQQELAAYRAWCLSAIGET